MDFRFTEEQEELRAIAAAFLEEHSSPEAVRKAMETELGFDPGLWQQLATELGWTSVHIPEAYGGLGLGFVELAALLERMGEVLVCAPFFSSICMGANTLLAAGSEKQKEEHLPAVAEGAARLALAHTGATGGPGSAAIDVEARVDGDALVLQGRHGYVLDGHTADVLIVAGRAPGSEGDAGITLALVPGDHAGVTRRALPTVDQTRRLAQVDLDAVRVPIDRVLGAPGEAGPALARALDLAAVAQSAEQVGGAQRCLDMTIAHVKEREQFGRPIGSFQAIKHKCADMMIAIEAARSAAYYAACAAADETDELSTCASLAKAFCSEAYFQCAAQAIQVHGGVGFTWEYDVHLHFKRARASESFLGEPAWHRERIAQAIGL